VAGTYSSCSSSSGGGWQLHKYVHSQEEQTPFLRTHFCWAAAGSRLPSHG
jgi:hypothetical protein